MKIFLTVLAGVLIAWPALANKHRGVWFWRDVGSPYGASNIVGNAVLENQTIAFLQTKGVKRVYGSYGTQPITDPTVSASWNAKLQAAGMQSQFLMSENTWIFATNHPGFLTKISERVLEFNQAPGRPAAERFDGIHLDIEPQALGSWGGLTATTKRDYLLLLRDTYAAARQHLVDEGVPNFPLYADLPVWFDNLPGDGGSIGWTNAAERDQWFADIAVSLTGITLMPFDRLTFSSIDDGVSWERANISGSVAVVRVGLEADIGLGLTWNNVPEFNDMLETLESAYGPSGAVDVQSYRLWREALASQPIIGVAAVLRPAFLTGGGDIIFNTETNWTYLIHHTIDFCAWKEIKRVRSSETAPIIFPVSFRERQGFWRITRFQER